VDEQALEALVGEVEQAWNAHDMSRFAACFAEDADFVNVRGWWWRGRGEIEPTHALLHETMFSDSFMELERAATKEVGAGVVVIARQVAHGWSRAWWPAANLRTSNGHLVMGDSRSGGKAGDCLFPTTPTRSSSRRLIRSRVDSPREKRIHATPPSSPPTAHDHSGGEGHSLSTHLKEKTPPAGFVSNGPGKNRTCARGFEVRRSIH